MKKLGVLLFAGSLTLGLAACGGEESKTSEPATETASTSGAEEFTITATNWEFTSDKELTVKKGTNVKLNLVNEEGLHTIKSEDLGFDLTVDAPAEFTADKTGEFELICSTVCGAIEDHEGMVLTLKVVE
ncbi:cupredoxin domain-containing protein [Robertmurraya kyonggiensis]|uniref:Cytochrome C oxidase subunit II n=1 Tax=Robertmurraya kyonggiensis TaxID=1037680 RepID=A0A4U1D9G1_9BACI|nr:cupredoxin domain-containing protein [Robertmurraya kyonggiensis]TKC19141.1 cytochrome C oxidase subunit II [Robertmurraya kyonggiensis]